MTAHSYLRAPQPVTEISKPTTLQLRIPCVTWWWAVGEQQLSGCRPQTCHSGRATCEPCVASGVRSPRNVGYGEERAPGRRSFQPSDSPNPGKIGSSPSLRCRSLLRSSRAQRERGSVQRQSARFCP
eukprot:scaffold1033_cov408-Prasinococcus_capsulatus_cf.AAC.29